MPSSKCTCKNSQSVGKKKKKKSTQAILKNDNKNIPKYPNKLSTR